MASVAHCLYCFESLSARLERRQPLSLAEVEELWGEFCADKQPNVSSRGPELEEAPIQGASEEQDLDPAEVEAKGPTERNTTHLKGRKAASVTSHISQPSNPSLLSPPPGSSSSLSSSPSGVSKYSSTHTNTSISTSSSRSSLSSASQQPLSSEERQYSHSERHPMFVTWNSVSQNNGGTLRGCIGTFESQPLEEGLATYALTSAFEDVRFPPISATELPSLDCGVTLLTDFEPISNPLSWNIGKHGLRISFTYHSKRFGATYLPDVAREQGWTKTETLISLMRKAGWSGKRDEWQTVEDLRVVRYQGCKANMSYRTWRDWRDWASRSQSF